MQRDKSIDIAKAIGIILVVASHAHLKMRAWATLFHMPLFIFLSGYVFNDSYNIKELSIKKIKNLYFQFLKYEFIFLILHNLLFSIHIYEESYSLLGFMKAILHILLFDNIDLMLAPIWFLTAIFLITILFKLILNIKEKFKLKNWFPIIICIISMIIGICFTKIGLNLPFSFNFKECINVVLTLVIFFAIGYYTKKSKKINFSNFLLIIINIAILTLALNLNYKVDSRINYYSHNYLIIPVALAGIYITMFISKILEKIPKVNNIMMYIGRNTIPILTLHIIVFKLIGAIQVYCFGYYPINMLTGWNIFFYNSKWQYAAVILGILIPLGVSWLWKMIKTKLFNFKNIKFKEVGEILHGK